MTTPVSALSAADRAALRARADRVSTAYDARGRRISRPPSRPRPLPSPRPAVSAPRAAGGTAARPTSSPGRAAPSPRSRPRGATFADVRRRAPTAKISRTNYQPVILAEFVAAVLLVSAAPVATGKEKTGLSPYTGADMLKLGALTAVYLILALISTGGSGPGRFSAWFGGLILLAVGLGEGANIAKELDLFGATGAKVSGLAAKLAPGKAGTTTGHKK